MSIYRRGSIFHYKFMVDGVRYWGSTKEKTIGKARQFEALLITEIREGGHNPKLRKKPLLSEFAPTFLTHIEKCVAAGSMDWDTQKDYKNGWRLLSSKDIAGMRLDDIGTAEAAELVFTGSPSTANSALRTLRRMLSSACEQGILKAAPKIHLREVHGRETLIEPWVEDLLLKHAPKFLADILTIMLDCGMRPEEVRRIQWENVLWDRGLIFIRYGKSDLSSRYVGITDRMRDVLQIIRQDEEAEAAKNNRLPSIWVFPGDSESGHRENSVKAWNQTLESIEDELRLKEKVEALPAGLVLYCARHTFATNFLKAGGHVTQLQKLLGHASLETTMKYVHMVADGSAEIMNRHNRSKRGLHIIKSA